MRRVIAALASDNEGVPSVQETFAYLQLKKLGPADLPFDLLPEETTAILRLHRLNSVDTSASDSSLIHLGRVDDCDLLLALKVDEATISALADWVSIHEGSRIAVYSGRPLTVQDQLTALSIQANSYGIIDTILQVSK